jgi:hypothetical protein
MPKGLPLYVLIIFLCQKVSITLKRMQTSSILSRVITVGLVIFQLSPHQDTPPITMANLLKVVNCWDGEILSLVCVNLMPCKFSLFFFLILLYIFQICNVFINKVLQGDKNLMSLSQSLKGNYSTHIKVLHRARLFALLLFCIILFMLVIWCSCMLFILCAFLFMFNNHQASTSMF